MAFSESLKPHIPYLRRHARLLTGDQALGDDAVRDALQAAARGDVTIDENLPPRVALYRLFHARWRAETGTPVSGDEPQQRLARIPTKARQALLLTAVESFSARDTALILDLSHDDIDRLLVEAQSAIEDGLRTCVMIIEDEPVVALDIEAIVGDSGHTIAGTARTHREAVDMFRTSDVGLVLADIQLADGSSGVDAVNEILADNEVPVIFITAYPERLLTGERPEPAYLITKPFMPETVAATISQVLFFAGARPAEPAPAQ
ncbi:response regulator [Maricaulis sp.]|uniref:response regulator n=1 Tax=Maricaulis sp. TaxID=1486257 RepID=UPI00261F29E4|nr:response regulator [Maricaulis sp.]